MECGRGPAGGGRIGDARRAARRLDPVGRHPAELQGPHPRSGLPLARLRSPAAVDPGIRRGVLRRPVRSGPTVHDVPRGRERGRRGP